MVAKKIIVHLIQSLPSGGCENQLLRLLPQLAEYDHRVITLTEPGELATAFRQAGLVVENIGFRSLVDRAALGRLRRRLSELEPAVIMTYLFRADVIGRLWLRRSSGPHVIPSLRTTYHDRQFWIAQLFERLTHPWVKEYVANSNAVRDFYSQYLGVSAKKFTVIPNGIDVVSEPERSDASLRTELGIAPDAPIITCVANFHPYKGHRYLLEALENVAQTTPAPVLLLVGQGKEEARLRKQIRNYRSRDSIKFLGRRRDIPRILVSSDLFVLPSLFEGMSNALLEAAVYQCPIIVSDIPENRAVLKHARFVQPKDIGGLTQALQELLNSVPLREQMRQAAYEEVRARYSMPIVVKQWREFYGRVTT